MSKHSKDRGHQAFRILQVVFVLLFILVGLDKFFYYLTEWSDYLSPMVWQFIDGQDDAFFMVVGAVEIIVGLGVLLKPRIFAYIVSLWYLVIIINFFMLGDYWDITLNYIGLMFASVALGKLAHKYDTK